MRFFVPSQKHETMGLFDGHSGLFKRVFKDITPKPWNHQQKMKTPSTNGVASILSQHIYFLGCSFPFEFSFTTSQGFLNSIARHPQLLCFRGAGNRCGALAEKASTGASASILVGKATATVLIDQDKLVINGFFQPFVLLFSSFSNGSVPIFNV